LFSGEVALTVFLDQVDVGLEHEGGKSGLHLAREGLGRPHVAGQGRSDVVDTGVEHLQGLGKEGHPLGRGKLRPGGKGRGGSGNGPVDVLRRSGGDGVDDLLCRRVDHVQGLAGGRILPGSVDVERTHAFTVPERNPTWQARSTPPVVSRMGHGRGSPPGRSHQSQCGGRSAINRAVESSSRSPHPTDVSSPVVSGRMSRPSRKALLRASSGPDMSGLPSGVLRVASVLQSNTGSRVRVRFSSKKPSVPATRRTPSHSLPASSPRGVGLTTGPKNDTPSTWITGVPTSSPTSSMAFPCERRRALSYSSLRPASPGSAGRPASASAARRVSSVWGSALLWKRVPRAVYRPPRTWEPKRCSAAMHTRTVAQPRSMFSL